MVSSGRSWWCVLLNSTCLTHYSQYVHQQQTLSAPPRTFYWWMFFLTQSLLYELTTKKGLHFYHSFQKCHQWCQNYHDAKWHSWWIIPTQLWVHLVHLLPVLWNKPQTCLMIHQISVFFVSVCVCIQHARKKKMVCIHHGFSNCIILLIDLSIWFVTLPTIYKVETLYKRFLLPNKKCWSATCYSALFPGIDRFIP